MKTYAAATLYVRMPGGDWVKETRPHEELVTKLNALSEYYGAPTATTFTESSNADIVAMSWGEDVIARYVMHHLPPHVTVYCPTCRREVLPPEYGQVVAHTWQFHWELDDGIYICNSITDAPGVKQCGQPASLS